MDLYFARSVNPVCAGRFLPDLVSNIDIKSLGAHLLLWRRSFDLLARGGRLTQETKSIFPSPAYVYSRSLLGRFGREIAQVQPVSCPIL
jgi:hypothetical protein